MVGAAGDLIQIDIKTLARFRKIGHNITSDAQEGRCYGVSYYKVHIATNGANRLAPLVFWLVNGKPLQPQRPQLPRDDALEIE